MPALEDEQTTSTLAAVARFNAAFDRHDVDGVMAAMTEDCVFENAGPPPDGERYVGAPAVRAVWQRFFETNPRASFEVEGQFAAGDRCVVRWRYTWDSGHVAASTSSASATAASSRSSRT